MSAEEQVEFLIRELPNITNNERAKSHRQFFAKLMENHPEMGQRFVEAAWKFTSDAGGVYALREKGHNLVFYNYYKIFREKIKPKAFGDFLKLNGAVKEFITAQDLDGARNAARTIREIHELVTLSALNPDDRIGVDTAPMLYRDMDIVNFELLPDQAVVGEKVPWVKHTKWVWEDSYVEWVLINFMGVKGIQKFYAYKSYVSDKLSTRPSALNDEGISSQPRIHHQTCTQTRDYNIDGDGIIRMIGHNAAFSEYEERYRDEREDELKKQTIRLQALKAAMQMARSPVRNFRELAARVTEVMAHRRGYYGRGMAHAKKVNGEIRGNNKRYPHYYDDEHRRSDQHPPVSARNQAYAAPPGYKRSPQSKRSIWQRLSGRYPPPARLDAVEPKRNKDSLRRYVDSSSLSAIHEGMALRLRHAAINALDNTTLSGAEQRENVRSFHRATAELMNPYIFDPEHSVPRAVVQILSDVILNRYGVLDGEREQEYGPFLALYEDISSTRSHYQDLIARVLKDDVLSLQKMVKVARRRRLDNPVQLWTPGILNEMRELLGYREPRASLDDVFHAIEEKRPFLEKAAHGRHDMATADFLMGLEAYVYLLQPEKYDNFDIAQWIPKLVQPLRSARNYDQDWALKETRANLPLFRQALDTFLTHHDRSWPGDTEKLIDAYKIMEERDLFLSNKVLQTRILGRIVDKIGSDPNVTRQLYHIERMLSGEVIYDTKLRKEIIDLWVNNMATRMGQDDGSPRYTDRASYYIDPLLKNDKININDRRELLARLSVEIVSQRETTELLADHTEVTAEKMKEQNDLGRSAEVIVQVLTYHPVLAERAIECLIDPNSVRASRKLFGDIMRERHKTFKRRADDSGPKIDEVALRYLDPGSLQHWHQSFQSQPLPVRAYIMNRLLTAHSKDSPRQIDLIEKLLVDPKDPHKDAAGRAARTYVEGLEDYERSYLLAGVLVASGGQEDKGHKKGRMGEGIGLFCAHRGPGEKKFGQALNSMPGISPAIREGTAALKGESDIPSRQKIHELYEARVPMEVRDQHHPDTPLGRVVGAGAYWISVEINRRDGSKSVMQLLRDDAEINAKRGLDLIEKSAEALEGKGKSRTKDSVISMIAQVMRRGARQARRLVETETSSTVGYHQSQIAHTLYDGTDITVNGHVYEFRVAPWLNYGEGYKEVRFAPGTVFAKLPDETEPEIAYKRDTAKAMFTMETMIAMAGEEFDGDRHGYQSNVEKVSDDRSIVWIFDNGAMSLDKPTTREKRVLADVMYGTMKSARGEGNFGGYLMRKANTLHRLKLLSHYIEGFQKGLLALNDLVEYRRDHKTTSKNESRARSFTQEDWHDIFGAVEANRDRIDPIIEQTLALRSMLSLDIFRKRSQSTTSRAVSICFNDKPVVAEASHFELAGDPASRSRHNKGYVFTSGMRRKKQPQSGPSRGRFRNVPVLHHVLKA